MMNTTIDVIDDRFQVTSLLGEGSFGSTYSARDRTNGTRVAVKVLDIGHLDKWKNVDWAMESFEREAELLKQLDHPRIPDYVDYLWDPNARTAYLAQQLAPGRPISDMLEEGRRFDEDKAIDIARQLLEVLDYLRSLDPPVFHRDIRPENLILDHDSVYLVDFGLLRFIANIAGHSESTTSNPFGYRSPENTIGEPTTSSELYALGMTLIHMLTGRVPKDLNRTRERPGYRAYVDLSPGFSRVIDGMTEMDVDDRIDSPAQCIEMLDGVDATDSLDDNPFSDDDIDFQPNTESELQARLARREAREQAKQDAEQAKKNQRQRELERRRQREDICTQVRSQGPHTSLFEFGPPRDRLIRHHSPGGAAGYYAITIFALIVGLAGIAIVATAMSIDIPEPIPISFAGGLIGVAGLWWFTNRLRNPGKYSGKIKIEGDAFSLITPMGSNPEIIGRLDDLYPEIHPPGHYKVLGTVIFRHRGSRSTELEHLTPRELQRLNDFFADHGCRCTWAEPGRLESVGTVDSH